MAALSAGSWRMESGTWFLMNRFGIRFSDLGFALGSLEGLGRRQSSDFGLLCSCCSSSMASLKIEREGLVWGF